MFDFQIKEKIELFYQAAQHQTDVMIKNILGQGIDIHLLGLRQLARETACPEAKLVFEDPSYKIIHHFALSTSQVHVCFLLCLVEEIEIEKESQDRYYRSAGETNLPFLPWAKCMQIPTNLDSFMGYGPVVPDGYGCSYNPQPDSVIFCASSFHSCEATSTSRFVEQLSDNLLQVADMLAQSST